jgi:hypothetical protein
MSLTVGDDVSLLYLFAKRCGLFFRRWCLEAQIFFLQKLSKVMLSASEMALFAPPLIADQRSTLRLAPEEINKAKAEFERNMVHRCSLPAISYEVSDSDLMVFIKKHADSKFSDEGNKDCICIFCATKLGRSNVVYSIKCGATLPVFHASKVLTDDDGNVVGDTLDIQSRISVGVVLRPDGVVCVMSETRGSEPI